ncbi:hypothetical protein GCK72_021052 [Caenorhabditis remanei]|uniref:F-box domain-containing protein n=1 Tax=Caenorhabditis remanei TaxID=31234 RepID=A0A6A5GJI1_CAERE|nr:hypothetical protein GCK72_021052 [Caenorhabditis remanei]KAF1754489.1 hypothetical protein GCK72_021052 [Caenorhabditis remanei]
MGHILQNSPRQFRDLLILETIHQVPVFRAYQKFVRKFGQDSMSYQDYEFWYMRFLRGEYSMDYDRSQDPKTRSLMDMPLEIMEQIAGGLNIREKMRLRKVCGNLRTFIDTTPSNFIKILVRFESERTRLWLDDGTQKLDLRRPDRVAEFEHFSVLYDSKATWSMLEELKDDDCLVRVHRHRDKIVPKAIHWEMAMYNMFFALKNQKQVLEEISIENKSLSNFEEFETRLKCLKRKIRVKKVKIVTHYSNEESMILPYIDPETIEELEIEMKDWKVELKSEEDYKERIRKIVETETMLTSQVQQCVQLSCPSVPWEWIMCLLEREFDAIKINSSFYRIPIPNSRQFFEIILHPTEIKITRVEN